MAKEFSFALLDEKYAGHLLAINRACPIEADFSLLFERGQDFFQWPNALYSRHHYIGAFHEGRLAGYLMLGFFSGWIGDQLGICSYLGDARVLPEFRGQKLTEQMMAAMEEFAPAEPGLGLVLVKKGNLPAESLAATAASEKFLGHLLGDFHVMNIPLLRQRRIHSQLTVRNARKDDLEQMAQLFSRANGKRLFAPPVTAQGLMRDLQRLPQLGLRDCWVAEQQGRLVGMLAAWDMYPFHFTRLLRYSLSGQLIRAGFKTLTLLHPGATALPAPGGILRTLTINHIAIEDQDASILQAILIHALNANLGKGYHLMSVGFHADDPLIDSIQGFPLVQRFVSTLHCISRAQKEFNTEYGVPYVDLAMI